MENELGIFLEELRGKKSLREVARKSGLSHTYIRDLELGINRVTKTPIRPTPETLVKLSDAYDHPYNELMKMAGYMDSSKEEDNRTPVEKLIQYLEADLTNDEIRERMTFRVDGMTLTDEDVDEFIAFVRAKRSMKKQPAPASKSEDY